MLPAVTVLTQIPSPYQVELFDAVAASERVRLRVIYSVRKHPSRSWSVPAARHEQVVCEDGSDAREIAGQWIEKSDLAVFSYYGDRFARRLLRRRASAGRPWCIWGERPGGKWGPLGRVRRRFMLAELARSDAPIWGIGEWALNGWRNEFGERRRYENVPYFSNLERFHIDRPAVRTQPQTRKLLYSGALIPRKGVDLLAQAFVRLASKRPHLQLEIIGSGELEGELRIAVAPVRDRVRFWGFQQWEALPERYQAADVLCAPSRYDGWGLIVPEGLAAGLPVIATDKMGAAVDLIRPDENGWLVRAGSLDELEAALRHAVDLSEDGLSAMSRAAVETAATHTLAVGASRFCDAAEAAFTQLATAS